MTDKLRSRTITEGVQRAPNRSMLRAVGFGDADFQKPIVGIANGYSNITPCNLSLGILAKRAEVALHKAGCMPQVFGTITVSDGISMGTEGMKYAVGAHSAGRMSDEELHEIECRAIPGAGSCGGMYTANTMSSVIEAMGMSLPYSSTMAAEDAEKAESATKSAEALAGAIREQRLP